ncbi:hypothetical protein LA080_011901 [Diaporthe eres]|uniref:Uncharacterized protein n=1 Tax=Diaporthe vaccinii TaxID=105482 RepID=A0ABR4DYB3_9PEZI|nr:hypothetical protein LA080_011901 [Diaporthe eres]
MALSALDKKYPHESQQNPAFVPRDKVEYVFDEIAEFIVSATRKNCPETGDQVIAKGEYRLTLGDMRGLSYYVRDLTDELFKPKKHRAMHMKHQRPTPAVFNPPRAMQPTGSTPADPITSLNTSPADGPIRFPGFPRRQRRLPGPKTATLVSAENVTEITWFGPISGYPSTDESEAEANSSPSPETREIPSIVITQPSDEDIRSSASSIQGPIAADVPRRKQQNLMHVLPGVDEEGEGSQPQTQAEAEQPETVIGKIRRQSVELGQAVGCFVNGAYRNPDYKPRRESSAMRMRAILDRLSPPLPSPEENADVFSAMTGARPVTPNDVVEAKGRKESTAA